MSPIKLTSEMVRLPWLGKVRLGTKGEGDDGSIYRIPADHFVCPDAVTKAIGGKSKELLIVFPNEDREQWASQYFRRYSSSGRLICRGDGETALARADSVTEQFPSREPSSPDLREIVCNPRVCPHYQCDNCHWVMNLQFFLPGCPGIGVYQLDTGCSHSILNIKSMLDLTRSVFGRVSMIPLLLRLVERKVESEGGLTKKYVLNLAWPYSPSSMRRFAQRPPMEAVVLPPPDSEAPDDLFPTRPASVSKKAQATSTPDDKLLDLWARIKSKIYHFEIQDSQIADWFAKNYHLEVGLLDFDPPRPPARLTVEMLSAFCQSIDRHTGR